jgi:hypothetical protein
MSTGALFHNEMSETTGVGVTHCNIGASARPMVAFSGFYESHEPPPPGNAHSIVLVHRHGHQNGQQCGCMLHRCFVYCRPGGCLGNTERVVA